MTMTTHDQRLVSALVDWIEKNIDGKLQIDDVSRKSGYSKWHIQRKFKSVVGVSVASYIRNRKLTRAAIALKVTEMKIIDIAMSYGFDNQQTFTRTFSRHFGVSPGGYRHDTGWTEGKMLPRARV
ncbi:AraC family transcriptional activator of mar-sox-rob regulon [Enterobacillus tribolii]|uniref:AraC family transcriptional activator of mar-sox-rob regulon n=2 Tax=Enterobacillus tribolii TaxID=1487935 RepID=A0A370QMB5_9GAMM|nr:AraC family transcriptional activator of mar-sox-rob regulon [Enterobacillus tribolii]